MERDGGSKIYQQLELSFDIEEVSSVTLPSYIAPKNDNQKLLNFQYSYKIDGDYKALSRMYELGFKVALRFIKSEALKNIPVAALSKEERAEKAHNAITYIIARYLKVKTFAITESFTAYLFLRIRHELYYRRKVDSIVDFVDFDKLKEF